MTFYTSVKQDELKSLGQNQMMREEQNQPQQPPMNQQTHQSQNIHQSQNLNQQMLQSDMEETPSTGIMPAVVGWFMEKLGGPIGYDGPAFKVDDIMMILGLIPQEYGHVGSSQFKRRKL